MYNAFYGFREKPFSLTPDPHFLYLSSVHRKALAYLNYGLEDRKGFITVTGEVGAGKTTLIRALLRHINPNTTVARIINTTVSSLQLLKMIARDFGIDTATSAKEDILEDLNEFLLEQYSMGHNAVIIIDEAQNLGISTLEEIRLLSNLETEKDKLLQIILVGQPELRETLAQPELRQLRQRITVNYHISPLNEREVAEYIQHRLKVAGAKDPNLFTPPAVERIIKASKGIPRLINVICDAALVIGYVEETQQIGEDLVKEVLTELDLDYDSTITPAYLNKPRQITTPSGAAGAGRQENSLKRDIQQLCRRYSNQLADTKGLDRKTKELEEQIKQLNIIMGRLMEMEKELEQRAQRIKDKEEELGL